ncbi:hypothetical protein PRK78_001245 [Emydomyces testavorans]|uniref:DNA mismatch repair proteins mutS family domain-containing protein n=1 Tax=Emydomyces testavorans TaxID=2070801 RepID=A0AAF0IGI0_9EURO|nr:hypothetical protein PRK78_001245 [Emydomyces testavorans]
MTDKNIIVIKEGRHLLHEATVPSYVPNDTLLVGGKRSTGGQPSVDIIESSGGSAAPECPTGPSMLLLTGPNYSGKSVQENRITYQQKRKADKNQVALIVYMAHIGRRVNVPLNLNFASFVPAESATIGFTDKILTRITTRETVSKTQSTFAIDLQQIAFAIAYSTSRSLLLIDEFGKGTESTDGVGLACGLFEYFLSLKDECPKVVAATHFHEIFENGFLLERPELQFGHMEVRIDPAALELENQITYLYKLVAVLYRQRIGIVEIMLIETTSFRVGRSSESFGTICAAINGIDSAIVSRANEIGKLSRQGEDLVAACARMTPAELNVLEDAADFSRPTSSISRESQSASIVSILSSIVGTSDGTTADASRGDISLSDSAPDVSTEEAD